MGKEGTERIEDKVRNTLEYLKKEKESSDQRMGSVTKESERLKGYWMGFIWMKSSSTGLLYHWKKSNARDPGH